jgi:hypothetical protein
MKDRSKNMEEKSVSQTPSANYRHNRLSITSYELLQGNSSSAIKVEKSLNDDVSKEPDNIEDYKQKLK